MVESYGFVCADSLFDSLSEKVVLHVVNENKLNYSIDDVIKKILKPMGWTGQYRKLGTKRFEFPHLTKLKHEKYACAVPTRGKVKLLSENLDGLELITPFSSDFKIEKDDDFYDMRKQDIVYCFYDIEVTRTDAFTGFRLQGCKFKFIALKDTLEFFRDLHARFTKNGQLLVFVAYHDPYDGSVIMEASKLDNPTLRELRFISNEIFHQISTRNSFKKETDEKPLFNPLSKYLYTFDAMKDLVFQADSDEQFKKDGLKYNSAKNGLFYEAHIGSDLFEYNKTDVYYMEKLFNETGGDDRVRMILRLFDLSNFNYKEKPCAVSSKYALGVYIKNVFENGYLRKVFNDVKVRHQYWEYKLQQFGIEEDFLEDKPELIFDKQKQMVQLTGGKGGIHSKINSQFVRGSDDLVIYDIDFASFYPSIMIDPETEFIKKNAKEIISSLLKKRLVAKSTGDKLTAEALKLFLNSMYGKMKAMDIIVPGSDTTNQKDANNPSTGSLVPLIAKCKMVELLRIIQDLIIKNYTDSSGFIDVNTDGIIIAISNKINIDDALSAFTKDTVYNLEKKVIKWILYKGIGNYILLYESGEKKYKGSWIEGSSLRLGEDGFIHNILNLGDMLFNYIEYGVVTRPIIFEKKIPVGKTKESAEYSQVTDSLPFKVNFNIPLKSTNIRKINKISGEKTIIDDDFALKIIENKLKQCKFPLQSKIK
ncbi:MAG: hypothetical protein ACRCST_11575 [Turicibacter sp.]